MSRARLLILSLAMACHSARPEIQPQDSPSADARSTAGDCAPATERLPSDATADGLAGEYRVRIVATAGAKTGAPIPGPNAAIAALVASGLPTREFTFLGFLTKKSGARRKTLAALIAEGRTVVVYESPYRTGDLLSLDPLAPGVLVLERHPIRPDAPAEIMLRLGSDANRRGVVRYDGGYFALTVRRIGAGEFAGTWASGVATGGAEGYFCAERAGPAP